MKKQVNTAVVKEVGRRVKEARTKVRITQAALAEKIGVSTATVCKLEAGTTQTGLSCIGMIASILNIEILELFGARAADPKSKEISVIQRKINDMENEITLLQSKVAHLQDELSKSK